MKLLNAFSLNMITFPANIEIEEILSQTAANLLSRGLCDNCIGHQTTDVVIRNILASSGSAPLPEGQRKTVLLEKGEKAVVGQYIGPRLPEGATILPEGAEIKFMLLKVN